jgi:hypothetical protein
MPCGSTFNTRLLSDARRYLNLQPPSFDCQENRLEIVFPEVLDRECDVSHVYSAVRVYVSD